MLRCELVVEGFVDASAQGVLALRGECVFDCVPEDEDEDEDGKGDYEPASSSVSFRVRL
jgi:hypothetical protein